jgi:hypothetical protein
MVVLTKKQKMIAFAVAIVVGGGIIASIVIFNSRSKDPVKPAIKPPRSTLREKEVYYADKGGTDGTRYAFTTGADAEKYATSLGGTIATFAQLVEAYKKGLNQCSFAWGVDDGNAPRIYTVTTKKMNDDICRFPQGGVTEFFPIRPSWTDHKQSTGGVWVYGVKKPKDQSMDCANSNVPCVLPFSETKWSQYD